jgi:hypothetical protein
MKKARIPRKLKKKIKKALSDPRFMDEKEVMIWDLITYGKTFNGKNYGKIK